jgi:hypothetical protein
MNKTSILSLPAVFLIACFFHGNVIGQTERAGVQEGVRTMADAIVRDLHTEGPMAWLRYFSHSERFFMASNGQLVFPNIDTATVFVQEFARKMRRIDLTWKDIRVDSLAPKLAVLAASFHEIQYGISGVQVTADGYFTGTVEYSQLGWKLRDAHWSMSDAQH